MARDIDERKKRAALRKLRKAAELAEQGLGPPLSDWEQEFLEEVEARIEQYGSAFANPELGDLEEPMSALQKHKLKEIDKKARGKSTGFKSRGGFKSKKTKDRRPYGRDINDDLDALPAPEKHEALPSPKAPRPKRTKTPALKAVPDAPKPKGKSPEAAVPPPSTPRRAFRVIEGGAGKDET